MTAFTSVREVMFLEASLHRMLQPWQNRPKAPTVIDDMPRVARALVNLDEAMSSFPASTPGNGEPGGGKGAGGASIRFTDSTGVEIDRVPATSVEAMAMRGDDRAALDLERLSNRAASVSVFCSEVLHDVTDKHLASPAGAGPARLVMHAYGCASLVRRLHDARALLPHKSPMDRALRAVGRLERVVDAWAWKAGEQAGPARPDLLAVDPTEKRCRSHLRAGYIIDRHSGELCQWCYKFELAQGFPPPLQLVQLTIDRARGGHLGPVYDHEIAPFRAAERDRKRMADRAGRAS
jgi:hypothetical protein